MFYLSIRVGDALLNFRDGSKTDIIGTVVIGFILGILVAYYGGKHIERFGVALIGAVVGAMLTIFIITYVDLDILFK